MLDDAARKDRYLAQTGRKDLTARQRRRADERKAERARFRLGVQAATS